MWEVRADVVRLFETDRSPAACCHGVASMLVTRACSPVSACVRPMLPAHAPSRSTPHPTYTHAHQQRQDLVEQGPRTKVARLVRQLPQSCLALRGRAVLNLEQQLHDLALLGLLKTQLSLVHILSADMAERAWQ